MYAEACSFPIFIFSAGVPVMFYFCLSFMTLSTPFPQAPMQVDIISPEFTVLEICVISCSALVICKCPWEL